MRCELKLSKQIHHPFELFVFPVLCNIIKNILKNDVFVLSFSTSVYYNPSTFDHIHSDTINIFYTTYTKLEEGKNRR